MQAGRVMTAELWEAGGILCSNFLELGQDQQAKCLGLSELPQQSNGAWRTRNQTIVTWVTDFQALQSSDCLSGEGLLPDTHQSLLSTPAQKRHEGSLGWGGGVTLVQEATPLMKLII